MSNLCPSDPDRRHHRWTDKLGVQQLVRVRHGYAPESYSMRKGRRGQTDTSLDADRKILLLTNENDKLVGKIGRLEERLAVLERIATDPAERTTREIDAMRDR